MPTPPDQDDPVLTAWQVLKEHASELPDFWTSVYRDALRAAFRKRDHRAGVGLAIFAAASLEFQGNPGLATTHLNDAIAVFASDREARAQLLGVRAIMEAVGADPRATHTLQQARRGIRGFEPAVAFEVDTYAAVVGAIQLRPGSIALAERNEVTAASAADLGLAAGTKPWVVAAMHAFGMAERSAIWITSLGAYADAHQDVFRQADVAALDFATRARGGLVAPADEAIESAPRNTIARWRVGTTSLYLALLRRDRRAAQQSVEGLRASASRMNPAWGAGLPVFDAAVRAWFEDGIEEFPPPPETLSVVNLPAALAGLGASSQGGSQDDAVLWRRWADAGLPPHVQSALGWPVSAERLLGLSDVRLGRVGNARRRLERAMRWADAGGYPIERAVALVQLAELATLAGLTTTRERWQALRRRGRTELQEHGIDPDPVAYQVTRALALGRASDFSPKLTPREVEVLALLARGQTHREVAQTLGISARTAQVHAANAYGKLDANSRIAAITKARDLGLIA